MSLVRDFEQYPQFTRAIFKERFSFLGQSENHCYSEENKKMCDKSYLDGLYMGLLAGANILTNFKEFVDEDHEGFRISLDQAREEMEDVLEVLNESMKVDLNTKYSVFDLTAAI